ncbi:hypothetical protein BSKO_11267 [Bryopsis sp. KO-2023]|nr:hypothetical protein BSKO_11267 [Bryopsis sp. KO-2023]
MKPTKASEKDVLRMVPETVPTLSVSSPWDFWLKFRNRSVDAEFEASISEERKTLDGLGFKISIAAAVLKILSLGSMDTTSRALCLGWILLSGVILPWIHLRELTDRWDSYSRKRGRIHHFYKLAVPLGGAVVLLSQDPLSSWDSGRIWSSIVSNTPISALFFATFFFRLPFKQHAVLQGIGALLSWMWVFNFDHACDANPEIADSTNRIGWLTEGAILTTAVFGIPVKRPTLQPNDFPCWLVGLFFHFWLGWFVPCVCAYYWESNSKTTFVKERPKGMPVVDFRTFKNGRGILMAFVSVVGTQAMWFTLKGLVNADLNCRAIKL